MIAALFVLAVLAGFGVGFVLVLVVVGGRRKPTPQPPRHVVGIVHGDHVHIVTVADEPGPLLDAAIKRQTARLRAELEDPATVQRWLRGAP